MLNESVTAIGDHAFQLNNLTTVNIYGNPTLGNCAFCLNGLDRATIPDGIVEYGDEYYDHYLQNADLVRITATDADFIAHNQDMLYVSLNGGIWYAHSGYLINPASVVVTYQNQVGAHLMTQRTLISSNPLLQTYRMADYVDASNPSNIIFDQAKIASLYRLGGTIIVTPPAINGYIAPGLSNFIATQNVMTHTLTYIEQASGGIGSGQQQSTSVSNSMGSQPTKLADSGVNVWFGYGGSVVLFGGAVLAASLRRRVL